MGIETTFVESVKKQFQTYKSLGEKAIDQLIPNQLFVPMNDDNVNSIAIIIQHLHGNMLSRWTNFMMEDGEKKWRKRDEEFMSPPKKDKAELMKKWNEGWQCLFDALDSIKPEELLETIYIRNEGLSLMDAIHRQLAHYSYHVGQIVFYAKQLKSGEWKSLSIPKKKVNG
ncbi:MAG TPA: DUF1572 family protein [Flavobacteriales bacterium]|nr:DUF1572 family protein [Flavobacteriales bacterium]